MIPHERSLVKKFAGRPFVLLGVNSDQTGTLAGLQKYEENAKKHSVSWRSFRNEGTQPAISEAWGVTAWPTLFYIDHRGVIRQKNLRQPEEMAKALESLIAEAERFGGVETTRAMEVRGLPPHAPYRVQAWSREGEVVVEVQLEAGWHAYSRPTGKGEPIRISASSDLGLGSLQFPPTSDGVLRGRVLLIQELAEVNADRGDSLTLSLAVCNPSGCLPTQSMELILPPASPTPTSGGKGIAKIEVDPELQLELVQVAAQKFRMGSPDSEPGRSRDEEPRLVTLTREYWIGRHEITQKQWRQVMQTTPWVDQLHTSKGDQVAATYVSWNDAREFCRRLTKSEQAAERLPKHLKYDLPTEAEWELACRAGSSTPWFFGAEKTELEKFAVFEDSRSHDQGAHWVGEREPNQWGLYDMHGNVEEWCLDRVRFDGELRSDAARITVDPVGKTGSNRIRRGGSYRRSAACCRSAFRDFASPTAADWSCGFRVVVVEIEGRRQSEGAL